MEGKERKKRKKRKGSVDEWMEERGKRRKERQEERIESQIKLVCVNREWFTKSSNTNRYTLCTSLPFSNVLPLNLMLLRR
tara:strand:- start:223 stop:462 length:240 start_codon:yes stop_codon:yes gene_type:complete